LVSKNRLTRISERIREDLSEVLLMESSDPRFKGVTITDVEVDRELAFAEIYVCAIEGSQRSLEVLNALEHAQGYLRNELAHRMDLRIFPRLRFHWDPTLENADKIEQLIKSIHIANKGDQRRLKNQKKAEENGSKS
jgi:ribosome-binding factor A